MTLFFLGYGHYRYIHVRTPSFPTRRSSDLTAAPGAKNDFEVEAFVVQSVAGNISHTLNTSTGSSEDGSGRGVPIITTYARKALAFAQNSRGELRLESGHGQIAGALSTGGGKPGQGMPMVLSVALRGRRSEEHT